MRGEVDRTQSWTPEIPVEGLPAAADGDYYYAITFSDKKQDEWLISPRVKVEEGMSLSFYVYYSPMYLFNLDEEYVDWDTFSFIGEKSLPPHSRYRHRPKAKTGSCCMTSPTTTPTPRLWI